MMLAEKYVKEIFFEMTKIPVNKIDNEASLETYGIDSIMIINVNNRLNKDFERLRKTLLFEYRTINGLANYLVTEQRSTLEKIVGWKRQTEANSSTKQSPKILAPSLKNRFKSQINVKPTKKIEASQVADSFMEIAIIGMSGRYPQADKVDELWENLTKGKDCIEEIPKERWDYNPYYVEQRSIPGKMHSKWGGFIHDADKFDPLFFNISPREATQTDPQERLMLETAWATIEDAGYDPMQLQHISQGHVGVFVGVMYNEYQLLLDANQTHLFGNSGTAVLANRISYVLNLNGQSCD